MIGNNCLVVGWVDGEINIRHFKYLLFTKEFNVSRVKNDLDKTIDLNPKYCILHSIIF